MRTYNPVVQDVQADSIRAREIQRNHALVGVAFLVAGLGAALLYGDWLFLLGGLAGIALVVFVGNERATEALTFAPRVNAKEAQDEAAHQRTMEVLVKTNDTQILLMQATAQQHRDTLLIEAQVEKIRAVSAPARKEMWIAEPGSMHNSTRFVRKPVVSSWQLQDGREARMDLVEALVYLWQQPGSKRDLLRQQVERGTLAEFSSDAVALAQIALCEVGAQRAMPNGNTVRYEPLIESPDAFRCARMMRIGDTPSPNKIPRLQPVNAQRTGQDGRVRGIEDGEDGEDLG